MGPTLRFACDTTIAVTGADFGARLNGAPVARWQAVPRGSRDRCSNSAARRARAPRLSGDRRRHRRARVSRQQEHFHPRADSAATPDACCAPATCCISATRSRRQDSASEACPAEYTNEWEIGVLYGPHGAPDFFTHEDIEMFFSTAWKVHYNSDRTGVRLIGPKPTWARKDGGEAGLHPSNIHDNAYAVGTVDFTGDMPVILGPDGPSLGGFVCPATILHDELWKIGQLRPGDLVRFRRESDGGAHPASGPRRGLPRRWRSLPAGRVRPQRARSQPALPRARPGIATARAPTSRHPRHHARRALAADPLRHALSRSRNPARCARRVRAAHPRPRRYLRALAHRAPAALLGRSGDAAGHPQVHAVGAARRALVPQQYRIHPPHQRPGFHRRRAPHRVRRQLSGARPGRRLPGRAGRHAGRSAPSPGHHQVQSGAHLDAGKRGGHRRRLHVRLRHGRPRRLSVRGPHGADVEHLPRLARRGCCASSTRSASTKSAPRNCWKFARTFRTAAIRCASKRRNSA